MAAEAFGLVASVITITGLAYDSSKRLYGLINGFQHTSRTWNEVHADLGEVQQLLQSLKSTLEGTDDRTLSNGLRNCLQDLNPSIEACKIACEEFAIKLTQISSDRKEGNLRFWDKARLQFEEKDIMIFRHRLGSHKSTLSIALALATLKLSSDNQTAVQDLGKIITAATSGISGQIQGLEIALQSLDSADFVERNKGVIETLRNHDVALRQCLKMCTTAADTVPAGSGHTFRHLEVFDNAKHLVGGTIGNATVRSQPMNVNKAIGHQHGHQMFVPEIGSDAVEATIGGFFGHHEGGITQIRD